MRKIGLVLILLLFFVQAHAQRGGDRSYNTEFIWGINFNTNGGLLGGFNLKYGSRVNENTMQSFGLEMVNVKHPQERRYASFTGETYIFGKSNYLYSIRLQYGREKLFFKKAAQQGVQIAGVATIGPTIGLVAPYYVEIEGNGGSGFNTRAVPWNPSIQRSQILGTGSLFQGLGESKVEFGLNAKLAMNFEFGVFNSSVTGFEVGFMMEAFANEIVLMPVVDNRQVFTSAFLTVFFGSRK